MKQTPLVALKGMKVVLSSPAYVGLSLLFSTVILLVLLWLFNLPLLSYVFSETNLSLPAKIFFVFEGLGNVFKFFNNSVPILLTSVAVVQGLALSHYVYLRKRKLPKRKLLKKSTGSFAFSLIGSGCVACGGSIIYPVVALVSASAASGLSRIIGEALNLLALILALYALWGIASQIGKTTVKQGNRI
ncbi:MAG: hypothetical protein WDZ81_00610 [Candidatus Saccharimonadales bacterium]